MRWVISDTAAYIPTGLRSENNERCLDTRRRLPAVEHDGRPVAARADVSWDSLGQMITLHGPITAGKYVADLQGQVHPEKTQLLRGIPVF